MSENGRRKSIPGQTVHLGWGGKRGEDFNLTVLEERMTSTVTADATATRPFRCILEEIRSRAARDPARR
jgi:hypothetical protein